MKGLVLLRARHFKIILLYCPNYLKNKKEKKIHHTADRRKTKFGKNDSRNISIRIFAGGLMCSPKHKGHELDHQVHIESSGSPKASGFALCENSKIF